MQRDSSVIVHAPQQIPRCQHQLFVIRVNVHDSEDTLIKFVNLAGEIFVVHVFHIFQIYKNTRHCEKQIKKNCARARVHVHCLQHMNPLDMNRTELWYTRSTASLVLGVSKNFWILAAVMKAAFLWKSYSQSGEDDGIFPEGFLFCCQSSLCGGGPPFSPFVRTSW